MQSDDFDPVVNTIQLSKDKINIRIKQRNTKSSITIIENLSKNIPIDKILKATKIFPL